jgi:hypothetical protein
VRGVRGVRSVGEFRLIHSGAALIETTMQAEQISTAFA